MNSFIQLENQFGAHHYAPLPVVLERAQGVSVWDVEGRHYYDMMSAYSAVSHGHCHPKLIQVLQAQAARLNVTSRAFYSNKLGLFLERICTLSGFQAALPMNSGVEAVETAIKAARKWGYLQKKIPEGKAEIIVCENNFHGRTMAAISLSTEPQYRFGFSPFLPNIVVVPFGDAKALEAAITPNTAAFLMEPIQGEAGIIVPPIGYLAACKAICHRHQVLWIADEIQTGLGRTGEYFACDHEQIKPDAMLLGKALGGGILPISVFLTSREVMDVFTPGDHGSTFGGNPLAATVATRALEILEEENLIQNAKNQGEYFLKKLSQISSPLIRSIRGKGLLIGVEIHEKYPAKKIVLKLLSRGILTKETHHTVIRLAPPLIVNSEIIDFACEVFADALKEAESEI